MTKLLKHLDFIVLDLLALESSYFIANYIYPTNPGVQNQLRQAAVLLLCHLLAVLIRNPFIRILRRNKWMELRETIKHTLDIFVLDILVVFMVHDTVWMSRLTLGLTFALYFVLGYLVRVVWKRVIRRHVMYGNQQNALVVVCTQETKEETIRGLTDRLAPYFIKEVLLYKEESPDIGVTETSEAAAGLKGPDRGNIEELLNYITHNWVDEVVIHLPLNPEAAREIENHLSQMGITTHLVVADYRDNCSQVEKLGQYIVATQKLRDVPMMEDFLKRMLDIVGAVVGLICTGLIFVFVAPQIYKADPGPIFYASDRVGKNGRIFKMYKFRSMYRDADAKKAELMARNQMQGLMFKLDDDPRVIGSEKKDANGRPNGIGNFIRRTSLDEFPQFLNVLKGDMSLVGTRPPTIDEWKQYSEHHRIRLSMRPGITGMWQVSGRSDITDFEEVVRLDEQYIETWTVSMDIKILLQTVLAVLQHKGAK